MQLYTLATALRPFILPPPPQPPILLKPEPVTPVKPAPQKDVVPPPPPPSHGMVVNNENEDDARSTVAEATPQKETVLRHEYFCTTCDDWAGDGSPHEHKSRELSPPASPQPPPRKRAQACLVREGSTKRQKLIEELLFKQCDVCKTPERFVR